MKIGEQLEVVEHPNTGTVHATRMFNTLTGKVNTECSLTILEENAERYTGVYPDDVECGTCKTALRHKDE